MDETKVAQLLPSEERGGKPQYDEDFKAGFQDGARAVARKGGDGWKLDAKDANRAYGRVSRKHGVWYKEGFLAAIDMARGVSGRHTGIAKKLRLKLGFNDDLRKQLIRLAHENPGKVREALLPLLKEAQSPREIATQEIMSKKASALWAAAICLQTAWDILPPGLGREEELPQTRVYPARTGAKVREVLGRFQQQLWKSMTPDEQRLAKAISSQLLNRLSF